MGSAGWVEGTDGVTLLSRVGVMLSMGEVGLGMSEVMMVALPWLLRAAAHLGSWRQVVWEAEVEEAASAVGVAVAAVGVGLDCSLVLAVVRHGTAVEGAGMVGSVCQLVGADFG